MERVVRMDRLMTDLATTVEGEENDIDKGYLKLPGLETVGCTEALEVFVVSVLPKAAFVHFVSIRKAACSEISGCMI